MPLGSSRNVHVFHLDLLGLQLSEVLHWTDIGSCGPTLAALKWFPDHLSLLVAELLQLPRVWDLVVQLHIC